MSQGQQRIARELLVAGRALENREMGPAQVRHFIDTGQLSAGSCNDKPTHDPAVMEWIEKINQNGGKLVFPEPSKEASGEVTENGRPV